MSKREPLVCDIRSGCVAVYLESRRDDTPGVHSDDSRNIIYSNKGATFNGHYWTMDDTVQETIMDMVAAYNALYCMQH